KSFGVGLCVPSGLLLDHFCVNGYAWDGRAAGVFYIPRNVSSGHLGYGRHHRQRKHREAKYRPDPRSSITTCNERLQSVVMRQNIHLQETFGSDFPATWGKNSDRLAPATLPFIAYSKKVAKPYITH